MAKTCTQKITKKFKDAYTVKNTCVHMTSDVRLSIELVDLKSQLLRGQKCVEYSY